MDVKNLTPLFSTPAAVYQSIPALSANRIVPKHKIPVFNLHGLTAFTPLNDNTILTALTQRKFLEAHYRQKESFDQEFNKKVEKDFKENLEVQEKQKKIEDRKMKEEEFQALKEAKIKLKLEEIQRDKDDIKRGQEQLKRNLLNLEEKKIKEKQFMKDKRSSDLEFFNIKKKIKRDGLRREREMSVDSLRLKNCFGKMY